MVSSSSSFDQAFALCTVSPGEQEDHNVTPCGGKAWKTDSFYLDSSVRSSISLPLQLQFPSQQVLEEFLAAKCIHPAPSNYDQVIIDTEEDGKEKDNDDQAAPPEKMIDIEAKVTLTFGTGQAITSKVEGVTILSTKIKDQTILCCLTEIIVRVSHPETSTTNGGSGVKTHLEITAALNNVKEQSSMSALHVLDQIHRQGVAMMGPSEITTRLLPFELHVTLTHALAIAVRSVPGPDMGQTFLALSIQHSNTHQLPVTVTSIALHPGVTREQQQQSGLLTNPQQQQPLHQQQTVMDMSHSVHWGYAPQSDPNLPLTLEPHEAYSCFLTVEAKEDVISRQCSCPLSISAMLGNPNHRHNIVAAMDAHWTTSRTAVEPADSFRVDMSLSDGIMNDDNKNGDNKCVVGAPLTVHLEISNLSLESRQLMLLVDNSSNEPSGPRSKAGSAPAAGNQQQQQQQQRWRIVSEKAGYKFGVSGPDGDRDLLSMDAALLLGEIKGNASTKARLRIIPLREGSLHIPNFFLFDKRSGKRYSVVHRLQTFAQANNSN